MFRGGFYYGLQEDELKLPVSLFWSIPLRLRGAARQTGFARCV
jgi:hypothetical protein